MRWQSIVNPPCGKRVLLLYVGEDGAWVTCGNILRLTDDPMPDYSYHPDSLPQGYVNKPWAYCELSLPEWQIKDDTLIAKVGAS